MLKIFVTGDNHIGLKYASHEKSTVLARARIEAFCDMVERANAEECGLFVITGDLFENTHSISKQDVKELFGILSGFGGICAILPGNHDYYDPDTKLYKYVEELIPAFHNLVLLSEYRPYIVEVNGGEAVLYPALCTSHHSEKGENNLSKIITEDIVPDEKFRIGIAHGALEGLTIDNEGRYFLMTRDELCEIPLDVWLLGHTHVPYPSLSEVFSEAGRIFNPGTHTQTDVATNTEGCCFIVEIEAGNGQKKLRARSIPTGKIRFVRENISIGSEGLSEGLTRALGNLPDSSVVDISIFGALEPEEYEAREKIITAALSRFTEGKYNDRGLTKVISRLLIESEFAETSFAASFLTALLSDPKEAQLAYDLLKSLEKGEH